MMQQKQEKIVQEDEIDILAYVRILVRYWWFIGPTALIGGVGVYLICLYLPPKYRATTRFEIFENKAIDMGISVHDKYRAYSDPTNPLERHIVLLSGGQINESISQNLLEKYPDLENYRLSPFNLQASPVRGAETVMLDLSVDSFSKDAAFEYLNLLLTEYSKLRLEESRKEMSDTRDVLVQEDERLNKEVSDLQDKIDEFKVKNNFIFMETKNDFNQKFIAELYEKANGKQLQLDILMPHLETLKNISKVASRDENREQQASVLSQVVDAAISFDTKNFSSQTRSSFEIDIFEWKKKQVEYRRVQAEYQIKLKKYKPAHPKMRAIIDQLEIVDVEQAVYAKNIISTLEGRVKTMKAERHDHLEEITKLEGSISGDSTLITKYETMKQRLASLMLSKNAIHARVLAVSANDKDKYFTRFIQKPHVLEGAVWPSKLKYSALGFIFCFGASSGIVLLLFIRRAKKYNFSKIIKEYGANCLATIPNFPAVKLMKNPLFLNTVDKGSVLSESYRSLRLSVEQKLEGGKTLVVTSFGPDEGKTTSSLNLALCWAWTDKKVLIIDGDFRRATLRKVFKDAPVEGLIEFLKTEGKEIDSYLVRGVCENLTYLPAGHSEELITELLEGKRMREVMCKLEEEFDIIIIDSAPAMRVVDTIRLSEMTAGTLVVARSGRSKPENVAQVFKRLPENKAIGFIVNDFRVAHVKYTKYGAEDQVGGYSYGYAYQNYKKKY